MSTIFLDHFGLTGQVLEYDLSNGSFRLINSKDLPSIQDLSVGFFVMENDVIIGVRASTEGPILFWDDQTLNLTDENIDVDISRYDEQPKKIFVLKHQGETVLNITYTPDFVSDGFGLMPEEDRDFFVWLKTKIDTSSFSSKYTGPPDAPKLTGP